jgi:hypothetical protein
MRERKPSEMEALFRKNPSHGRSGFAILILGKKIEKRCEVGGEALSRRRNNHIGGFISIFFRIILILGTNPWSKPNFLEYTQAISIKIIKYKKFYFSFPAGLGPRFPFRVCV